MIYKPHPYQDHATGHVIDNPSCGLFLDMGLGKTVATLTAIDRLIFDLFEVVKILVIAPKRVGLEVWPAEIQKWDHLNHLKYSVVIGTEKQRKEALQKKADIYIINRENVVWLVAQYGGAFPFDMVVIDELSSFKSAQARRFKALRLIRPKIQRVVGLTGTPVPNGLMDLWSEMYLLDMGERLGKTLGGYRDKYFVPGKRNGHIVYEYKLREKQLQQEIYDKIGDICISMKGEDYLQLPERIDRIVTVRFRADLQRMYDEFEESQVMALGDSEITAVNAAALTNKLLQFANGAVYREDGQFTEVHKEKLEALAELIEAASGQPVLIFYSYRHDLARIKMHLRDVAALKTSEDIKNWNDGKYSVMLAHPASAGHGLNLQAGGNIIIWYGLPWSLELYQQANKRLHRQGQVKPVIVHHLVAVKTMDEVVMKALSSKAGVQDILMGAIKAMIKKYTAYANT